MGRVDRDGGYIRSGVANLAVELAILGQLAKTIGSPVSTIENEYARFRSGQITESPQHPGRILDRKVRSSIADFQARGHRIHANSSESSKSGTPRGLDSQLSRIVHARLAAQGAFNATDQIEFLAAPFQFGFDP